MRKKKTVFESSQKDARCKTIQGGAKPESQEELWSELEEKVRESQWFAGDLYNYMKKHYSITRKRG